MTAKHFKDFADLYGKGFRPYVGEIMPDAYDCLHCPDRRKAYWIARWPILHCFGCSRRCTPRTPEGFQLVLPERGTRTNVQYDISPEEMLRSKALLRVDEAAYCLNLSHRHVYTLAADGRLTKHKDKPFRVTAESVIEEMKRVDW